MFAEPSVMAEQLLPYLLRMVDRYPQCPLLVVRLMAWAKENVPLVLDSLAACKELIPGTALCFFSDCRSRCVKTAPRSNAVKSGSHSSFCAREELSYYYLSMLLHRSVS